MLWPPAGKHQYVAGALHQPFLLIVAQPNCQPRRGAAYRPNHPSHRLTQRHSPLLRLPPPVRPQAAQGARKRPATARQGDKHRHPQHLIRRNICILSDPNSSVIRSVGSCRVYHCIRQTTYTQSRERISKSSVSERVFMTHRVPQANANTGLIQRTESIPRQNTTVLAR